jgi:hypothetical protein
VRTHEYNQEAEAALVATKQTVPKANTVNATYEGYSEINVRWAVKKTRRKNILLYTKVSYIIRLLLNIITLSIEALVIA